MNIFRIISQTLLITVFFVGSVSASETGPIEFKSPLFKSLQQSLQTNPGLFPLAGAFVAVNCGENTLSNKIASTLVKTAFIGAPSFNQNAQGESTVSVRTAQKLGFFTFTDAWIRIVVDQIAAIKAVKSALDSVEDFVGKKVMKVMRVGKEAVIGYAAYHCLKRVDGMLAGFAKKNNSPIYGDYDTM
jgi:hypothetical protein